MPTVALTKVGDLIQSVAALRPASYTFFTFITFYTFYTFPNLLHTSTVAAETRRRLPARNTEEGTFLKGAALCSGAIVSIWAGRGRTLSRSVGVVMRAPYAKRNTPVVASEMPTLERARSGSMCVCSIKTLYQILVGKSSKFRSLRAIAKRLSRSFSIRPSALWPRDSVEGSEPLLYRRKPLRINGPCKASLPDVMHPILLHAIGIHGRDGDGACL